MNKSDLKNGAVVELRNGDKCIKIDNTLLVVLRQYKNGIFGWLNIKDYQNDLICLGIKDFDIMKVNNEVMSECGDCIKAINRIFNLNKPIWTWIREEKPKCILTPEEYKYLKAVTAPIRDKVQYIEKFGHYLNDKISIQQYIKIQMKNNEGFIKLHNFEYKGMKLHVGYTLEELGL